MQRKTNKQTNNIMKMKKELLASLTSAALFGSVANAEIPLTDDLSAYGYIDMALTDADGDGTENSTSSSVAEFELGFAFTPAESKWSAVAEVSFDSNSDSTTTRGNGLDDTPGTADDTFSTETNSSAEFETVTISYAASDELSFTAGNILSYQGFETYDATGLYQFSYAGSTINDGSGVLYSAGYAVGACVDYVTEDYALGAWIGDSDDAKQSFEFLAAFTAVEDLTVKLIYADDPNYETVNMWASYNLGDFTFAAEYVDTEYEPGEGTDLEAFVFLAYYSFGKAGLTLRYTDAEYGNVDFEKFTISPSYAFSDNVFGLLEFSTEELGDQDHESFAAELIYSF